jgi:hypothetical protein
MNSEIPSQKTWRTLMPCPFTGPKTFCAGQIFLSQPKGTKTLSLLKNFCAGTKINFTECKSSFCLAQKFCDWHNM